MNKQANRFVYGNTLVNLAERYPFFVLDADLSKATGTGKFAEAYPQRFLNMGIAEQDMMATAAGIASCHVPVFASTFAMFGAGRAYEQIRNSIAYPKANVKIVCSHAGVMIGEDGASHQCIEDLSLMRTTPNMSVLAPSDAIATEKLIEEMLKMDGPCYMRFGRQAVETIYSKDQCFEIGKSIQLKRGQDLSMIACGEMVQPTLKAAKMLHEIGIEADVIDMHTIKPLDEERILECVNAGKWIVSIEDHNIIGGLGSAIAEVLATTGKGRLLRIGMQDEFGCSGTAQYLAEYFQLSPKQIANRIRKEFNK